MDKSIFTNDKREMVTNAIKRIEPKFLTKYTPPILTYNNELVNNLNHSIKQIEDDNNHVSHEFRFSVFLTTIF